MSDVRLEIRRLLDERLAADAMAAYYALHHPHERTSIVVYPQDGSIVTGYLASSRTGMDLFRPLITMRLPMLNATAQIDLDASTRLIRRAVAPSHPVIIHTRSDYLPLIQALFDITTIQHLCLLQLDAGRFEPLINVFVTRTEGSNGLPRFVIRQPPDSATGEVLASAGINWQSARFADISVYTSPRQRRQGYGRSVVSALVQHLQENGRMPLYHANQDNKPSIELAQRCSFVDASARTVLLEGQLRHP